MGRVSYKSYFQSTGTPTSIPRRTRHRLLRPKRLKPLLDHIHAGSKSDAMQSASTEQDFAPVNNDTHTEAYVGEPGPSILISDDDSDSVVSANNEETSELYDSSKINRTESLLLVYGFILRHKLSKRAIADLLTLLNFHLPPSATLPESVFLLEKAIAPDYSLATKAFYCPDCEEPIESHDNVCKACNFDLGNNNLTKSGKFFITFNLRSSFENLLSMPIVAKALQSSLENRQTPKDGVIRDITDGKCYRSLRLGSFDITCSVNTDGVSIFQSSKLSIWPILASINELPYATRRKHTILLGLWFGYKKPNFDTFLSPFVKQCNELSFNPINWGLNDYQYKSKIYFPMLAADSVARCSLQGIKQFNGEYGCPWCLIKGESLELDGNKRKWIYPPSEAPRRTAELFRAHLRILRSNLENNEQSLCYGVKAASQLILLQKFDIVDGFVFDYMHTCLLGVVKTLTMAWFDSTNHNEEFYLGTKEYEISQVLIQCKIPYEINRVTRELKDMSFWKANEWKTWMLLAVPILQNYLKPAYINHFSKFVLAMMLLNSDEIKDDDLTLADRLLRDFCSITPNLYGKKACTFNMHLLLHATNCVRQWGPLWAYSLFQFEHNNGVLTSYYSGTSQVCMQIIKKSIIVQQINSLGRCSFKNTIAREFFDSLVEAKRYTSKSMKVDFVTFLGCKKKYIFNDLEKRKLNSINLLEVSYGWSFKTVISRGRKFSISGCDTKKTSNSICKVHDSFFLIERMLAVANEDGFIPMVICKRIFVTQYKNFKGICKVVNVSDSLNFINICNISACKCISYFNKDNVLLYIVELLNTVELE